MNKKHIKYFEKLITKENTYSDKAHLLSYSYDAAKRREMPDLVLFPRDEISHFVKGLLYVN